MKHQSYHSFCFAGVVADTQRVRVLLFWPAPFVKCSPGRDAELWMIRDTHRDPAGHCHNCQWTVQHTTLNTVAINAFSPPTRILQTLDNPYFQCDFWWCKQCPFIKGLLSGTCFSFNTVVINNNGQWLLDKMPLLRPYEKSQNISCIQSQSPCRQLFFRIAFIHTSREWWNHSCRNCLF